MEFIVAAVVALIGIGLIFWGRSRGRLLGHITATPTPSVSGLISGRQVELKGRAEL